MAYYFVKTTGSDSNNGTTWALAKLTIQAGMNLCTSTADRLVIAPGRYVITTSITPAAAGARGSQKMMYGDFNSDVADGGSNLSGVEAGLIIIDMSVAGSGSTPGSYNGHPIGAHNNWAYWSMRGIYWTGGGGNRLEATTGGTVSDGCTFTDCIFETTYHHASYGGIGLYLASWTVDPDTYSPYTFTRCIFNSMSGMGTGGDKRYSTGLYTVLTKTGSHYTNDQVVLDRCILIGAGSCITMDGAAYKSIKAYNCTFILKMSGGYRALFGMHANDRFKMNDCVFYSGDVSDAGSYTFTRCIAYRDAGTTNNGVSNLDRPPFLPQLGYLHPTLSSGIIDANSSNGTTPDVFGNTVSGSSRDYGAQEYVEGYHLKRSLELPQVGSSGGGLPILKGSVVR